MKQVAEVCGLYEDRIKKEKTPPGGWASEGGPALPAEALESQTEQTYRNFKRQIRDMCYSFKIKVTPPVEAGG